jgi:hypothetical protein
MPIYRANILDINNRENPPVLMALFDFDSEEDDLDESPESESDEDEPDGDRPEE